MSTAFVRKPFSIQHINYNGNQIYIMSTHSMIINTILDQSWRKRNEETKQGAAK